MPWPASAHAPAAGNTDITYFGAGDPRTTREIRQRLTLRAGPLDEHLVLSVRISETQMSPGPLTFEGEGRFGAPRVVSGASSTSVTGGRTGCETPPALDTTTLLDVLLPAHSRTTISYTATLRLTRAPAGPGDFVQQWQLAPASASGSSSTAAGTVTISSKPVELAGLKAARVSLRVAVAGSRRSTDDPGRFVVRSRTRLTVGGYVANAREGDSVTIWRFAPGAKTPARLARVRIDRHGRYSAPWRPAQRGTWDLYATYAGREGLVEPARSPCGGPQVRVRRWPLAIVALPAAVSATREV